MTGRKGGHGDGGDGRREFSRKDDKSKKEGGREKVRELSR